MSLAAPSIHTLYNAPVDFRDALVIGISQSGESTDTNLVLERARAQGALTIGITNEASSAMAKLADEVFLVRAGREKSVAATKTYTGQVLCCTCWLMLWERIFGWMICVGFPIGLSPRWSLKSRLRRSPSDTGSWSTR